MKKLLMILLVSGFATQTEAQTFSEWFKQRKTQKKYLLQQIAALQIYMGFVQKGYALAKKGLSTISDIKNGEFNLHDQFFNSLKKINPNIENFTKVSDIITFQIKILQTYNTTYKWVQQSNTLNSEEIDYIYRVYSRLINDCSVVIDHLITLTTDDKLEMKDDERLKNIDALFNDMQDKHTFIKSFSNETIILVNARIKEKNNIKTSHLLNGIKKQ